MVPTVSSPLLGVPAVSTLGATFTMTASGFAPNALVAFGIYFSPRTLGHVNADASGTARKFSEMLDEAVKRYTNRSLSTAEIIAELVRLAKQVRDDQNRHEPLGLREDEVAFYDAAVLELGDETLKAIARDLVKSVRQSATLDWNLKTSVLAAMRSKVRRILARYDYPPDAEEKAVDLVLKQAEVFAELEA